MFILNFQNRLNSRNMYCRETDEINVYTCLGKLMGNIPFLCVNLGSEIFILT